ncbi:MAG TPA: hypothetical protein DD729_03035 [Rhodobacteraceae bacterium]|nr:hypothetical protein [Paracoccaceae bacterium]
MNPDESEVQMHTSSRPNVTETQMHDSVVLPGFLELADFLMQGLFPNEQRIASLLDRIEGTP